MTGKRSKSQSPKPHGTVPARRRVAGPAVTPTGHESASKVQKDSPLAPDGSKPTSALDPSGKARSIEAHRESARKRLWSEVKACLANGKRSALNFSTPRHGVAMAVLRRLAYAPEFMGRELPIIFRDGSRPPPFPAGVLAEADEPKPRDEAAVIRVGLMSLRHPEMDFLVDAYVTRNQELAEQGSYADVESLAFERTVEFLHDPAAKDGLDVWVYHTGYEPMVVGFYRGVTRVLTWRSEEGLPRRLVIRPFILLRPPEPEVRLTPDSSGAKHSSYSAERPWW